MVKVRPQPHHPRYWEWQFGFVYLWLHAIGEGEVKERAFGILERLHYQVIKPEEAAILEPSGPQLFLDMIDQANKIGFAMQLVVCATGTEEIEFEE